ncbi:MAG: tetratricopeptide repeat protein [Candidatus Delongbacteria bacterium]
MSKILIILAVLLTLLATGCTKYPVRTEDRIENRTEDEKSTAEPEFLYMEEVYAHAKNSFSSGDWNSSFAWYERLQRDYPDNPYMAESLFMRGYINKTLKGENNSAKKYFKKLINNYPGSDFCNSAKFELEHIDDPGFMPEFEKQEKRK